MALCIAYLCISSFSASFCKRNIIKIIMKIRFCELSSLGAPVFMALLVPWGLPFWAVPWAAAVDWILQRPWGWARAWDGHGGIPDGAQGEGLTSNPPGRLVPPNCCRIRTLCSPPRPQSSSQWFGTASPLRWPLQPFTPGGELVQLVLSSFCTPGVKLSWTLLSPDPCTDPTEPPELLLPSCSQRSVGLSGIFNVCKKPQMLLLRKETKHSLPLLLPLHFWTPKAAIQWLFGKQQSSVLNYLKG